MKPYSDQFGNNGRIRTFLSTTKSTEFIWHRDAEDRLITPLTESNWKIQLDNQLPIQLNAPIYIKAGEWHRLIKGDGDLKINILNVSISESKIAPKYGYRAGMFDPDSPAEMLKDKGIGLVTSKVGLLGTGYYFFGSISQAEELNSKLKYGVISRINLNEYKLFRPDDAVIFYENLRDLTQYFNQLQKSDLSSREFNEYLKDAIEIFSEYLGLEEFETEQIFIMYINDVIQRRDGVLLSNRLLTKLGFDGIDFTGTELDHFGVGSLIFAGKLKNGTFTTI
jgi:hypothetical protein